MRYLVTTVLTLLGLANALQCAEVNRGRNTWSSGPRVKLEVRPRIEEWPHNGPGKKLIIHKKNEPLNMTCTVVYQNSEKDDHVPFDYTVDWKGPRHVDENPKIERGQSRNAAWIWFERLAEKDAGDYSCVAISHKPWAYQTSLSILFYLFVEHKPTFCGPQWFKCFSKTCIMERYVCDGKQDCEQGEDESPKAGCGPNPCFGKVFCEDRCIPPEWCCDHRNCSGTFGLRPWPHENHEISYVQTAFYTVIGCAMAFMFIVTILVIAICRVQIKRAMNSRCSQQNNNAICSRRAVPLYDLDVYLNRTADVNYPGGVSIMYNINSGVQFVGRPSEPPPYSEVVTEPLREGPPPPYVSCENLIVRVANPRFQENTENIASSLDEVISVNAPLNTNGISAFVPNPLVELDTRGGTTVNQRENAIANIVAPRVPIYSHLPQNHEIIDRDSLPCPRTIIASQSCDSNDAPATIPSESSTACSARNVDLEFVETDVLLDDNLTDDGIEENCTKEATFPRKSIRRATVKNRWLSNDRWSKRAEKKWYGETEDSGANGFAIVESSSHRDSENEGIFLDTDEEDSTFANSSGARSSPTNDASSPPLESLIDAPLTNESVASSSSNFSKTEETASAFTALGNVRKKFKTLEKDRDKMVTKRGLVTRRKKAEGVSFFSQNAVCKKVDGRGKARQSSRNNEEINSKNVMDPSVCVSAEFEDRTDLGLGSVDTNPQISQSSHVLPLRESFIGVQRDRFL